MNRFFKSGSSQSAAAAADTSDSADSNNNKKKSLYQRVQDKKRGKGPSDEDITKYTGKSRDELNAWAESQPGVGKNQLAGKLALGPASGFEGMAAGAGYGGWGPGAEPNDGKRGMKFPPEQGKAVAEESD